MKKDLSILALIARHTQNIMYLSFAVMIAAGSIMLFLSFDPAALPLEAIIEKSKIRYVFQFFILWIVFLLFTAGCQSDVKCGYSLRRLAVSEKRIFIWQSFYNSVCFILLWGIQAVFMTVFSLIYLKSAPKELLNHQTLYLAFHKSSVLFSLIPMSFVSRWICNLIMMICLGVSSAYFPFLQRRKAYAVSTIVLSAFVILSFFREPEGMGLDIILSIFSLYCAFVAVYRVISEEQAYDEN